MKDSPTPAQSTEIASEFVESLQKGLKQQALQIMGQPDFNPDTNGGQPLTAAIDLGFIDIASRLLETGADPNAAAGQGKPPILLALEKEYFGLAELMLSHGAEISIRDRNGWTPLIWAAIKGREKIVEFLIANGAEIHVCSNDGWNAITGAFFKNHTPIVKRLFASGAKFGEKYREAALLSAYEHGSTEIVQSLISDGVNVNIATAEGQPLLILATARGDMVMLDLILAAGADVNVRDTNGNPALVSAIESAQYAAAARLVENDASVNVKGPKWAPIHVAALHGRTELCKILLDAGASVDQLGVDSRTALMLSAKEEHAETVRLLLENGADPNRKNDIGTRPERLSRDSNKLVTPTTKILQEFGGK